MKQTEEKIVRWLLKLYPADFRRTHGEELVDFVQSEVAHSRGRRLGRTAFWLRTSTDLLRGAIRLRWTERKARRPRRPELGGQWLADFRQGFRSISSKPLVTSVVVLTLALGIGLNTAIFSVVQGVLLKPLSYKQPDRLFFIGARWVADGVEHGRHGGLNFKAMRRDSHAFEDIAAVTDIRQNLTGVDPPLQVRVGWASRNLFALLGVDMALGPGFTADAPPGTMVLSHHLWQQHFGGKRDVIGAVVELDGHPYTVAGVAPRGFKLQLPRFSSPIDVWKVPDDWWQNGDVWSEEGADFAILDLIGRLDSDATAVEAQEEMNGFAASFRAAYAEYDRAGLEYAITPLRETVVGEVRSYLLVLLGAVALVLLIACANVMNLMLARAQSRRRDVALRLALGGSRARIVRSLLTESLLLALLGGAAGVGLGLVATDLLAALKPASLPRLEEVSVNGTVLGFAIAVSVLSTFVFGLVPAFRASRHDPAQELQTSRVTTGRSGQRLSGALVVVQLSMSLVLLIGAGLLTTSLKRLAEVQPGFDYENLLTFSISLPGARYERPNGTDRFFRLLEERIEALPGVKSAGVVWPLPLSGRAWSNIYVAGGVREVERAYAGYRLATPDFFHTMGIRLLDGRTFSRSDKRHTVIVSRNLAKRAWPGQSAVGRVIGANPWGGGLEDFEVIGVMDDVRYADLREPQAETIYFDSRGWSWTDWEVDYVVRTAVHPEALAGPIRDELASMDGAIPMARIRTMSSYVDDHLAANRFALSLIGLFAVVAGVLAVIGLYGVISYSVSQRAQEIGIRMALGAGRSRVLSWVYRQGGILIALGLAIGMTGALLLTELLSGFLFGVTADDPTTFVVVASLLAAVSVLACFGPARRATRLDPMSVLRSE